MDGIAKYLPSMPPEIISSIMRHLYPFSSPPRECTYLVPPSYWLQALKDQSILPWLWDLDPTALTEKESSKPEGRLWDWELLVRQLAQEDTYSEYSGYSRIRPPLWAVEGLHPSLRNRRRVWDLALDMVHEDIENLSSRRQKPGR